MVKNITRLSILLLVSTTIFGYAFKFNIVLASSTGQNDKPDFVSQLGTILVTVFGIGGLFWGLYTYRGTQTLKRQQILFPLIEEFDKSSEMNIAKALLDDIMIAEDLSKYAIDEKYIAPREEWHHQPNFYVRHHLDDILSLVHVDDAGDAAIRKSFDVLLDFFCKLEYLLDVNLITREEIGHFRYYINKAADEPAVINYITTYKFPLRGQLHYKLFSPL